MAYDPWGSAGWSVNLVVMPVRGMCRWDRRTILLDIRLGRVEERCTLGHEIVYTERDSLPRWLTAREKAAIDADVACRFSLDALGDALAWSPHPAVAASRGRRFDGSYGFRGPIRPRERGETGADQGLAESLSVLGLQAGSSPKGRAMGHVRFTEPSFSHSSSWRAACFRGA